MKQSSLFNLPKQEKKPEAPKKQQSLFQLPQKPEGKAPVKRPDPPAVSVPAVTGSWIPQKDDIVLLLNITGGMSQELEGVVEFVDRANLYNDYMHPIQVYVPTLNLMIRSQLKNFNTGERQVIHFDEKTSEWNVGRTG